MSQQTEQPNCLSSIAPIIAVYFQKLLVQQVPYKCTVWWAKARQPPYIYKIQDVLTRHTLTSQARSVKVTDLLATNAVWEIAVHAVVGDVLPWKQPS